LARSSFKCVSTHNQTAPAVTCDEQLRGARPSGRCAHQNRTSHEIPSKKQSPLDRKDLAGCASGRDVSHRPEKSSSPAKNCWKLAVPGLELVPKTQGKLHFCMKATQKATHSIAVHGPNCGMQSPSVATCQKKSDNRSSIWAMPPPEAQETQHHTAHHGRQRVARFLCAHMCIRRL